MVHLSRNDKQSVRYRQFQEGYAKVPAIQLRALLEGYRQRIFRRDEVRVFAATWEAAALHRDSKVSLYRILNCNTKVIQAIAVCPTWKSTPLRASSPTNFLNWSSNLQNATTTASGRQRRSQLLAEFCGTSLAEERRPLRPCSILPSSCVVFHNASRCNAFVHKNTTLASAMLTFKNGRVCFEPHSHAFSSEYWTGDFSIRMRSINRMRTSTDSSTLTARCFRSSDRDNQIAAAVEVE